MGSSHKLRITTMTSPSLSTPFGFGTAKEDSSFAFQWNRPVWWLPAQSPKPNQRALVETVTKWSSPSPTKQGKVKKTPLAKGFPVETPRKMKQYSPSRLHTIPKKPWKPITQPKNSQRTPQKITTRKKHLKNQRLTKSAKTFPTQLKNQPQSWQKHNMATSLERSLASRYWTTWQNRRKSFERLQNNALCGP